MEREISYIKSGQQCLDIMPEQINKIVHQIGPWTNVVSFSPGWCALDEWLVCPMA